MGVIRWLDRIDPEKWQEAIRRLETERPLSRATAEQLLRDFGRDADENLFFGFEDLEEEPELEQALLNGLLEKAATDQSWELDKSLSHGFERLPSLLPSLAPLRSIIDFSGMDIEVPRWCGPSESGLYGCLSPAAYQGCVAAVERFDTAASLAAELRQVQPGFLSKVLGREGAGGALALQLEDDYFSAHWVNLRSAFLETAAKGHFLGLGMSV